jgi:hypothetical protein
MVVIGRIFIPRPFVKFMVQNDLSFVAIERTKNRYGTGTRYRTVTVLLKIFYLKIPRDGNRFYFETKVSDSLSRRSDRQFLVLPRFTPET